MIRVFDFLCRRGFAMIRMSHCLVLAFFFCFCGLSFAQSATTIPGDSSSAVQNQSLTYVKMEIGMHILDCPVLPLQLKTKLMTVKGIQDYAVNLKDETILFAVPQGTLTKEQVNKIAVSCGFPVNAVNVIMDSKPFPN